MKVWNLDPVWELNHFQGEVIIKSQAKRGIQLYNQRKIRKKEKQKKSLQTQNYERHKSACERLRRIYKRARRQN